MKKSWKWKMIGLLSAVASLFLLVGCQFKETFEDIINKHDLVAQITYHANLDGISIGDKYETKKTLYYKENSPALDLGASNVEISAPEVKLNYNANKYELLGWYEPQLNEDGSVKTNPDGTVMLKDNKLDLARLRLQKDDNFVVYAKWQRLEVVVVKLVCDENAVLKADVNGVEKEYRNGDEIKDYAFRNGACDYPRSFFTVKNKTHTFLEFYKTSDVTDPANRMKKGTDSWPISKTAGQDTIIYAHYIEGDYNVIRDADGVSGFFKGAGSATAKYYLMYDVDCSTLRTAVSPVSGFAAQLYGNGHTISNLTVAKKNVTQEEISLFGDVKASALLKDVTFENVNATYEINGLKDYAQVFWTFNSCADVATFDGVTFTGATLTVTRANKTRTTISNLYVEDAWVKTHYLFGGKALDSDYTIDGLTFTSPVALVVDEQTI